MAVNAAVIAATMILSTSSTIFPAFMVLLVFKLISFLIEVKASFYHSLVEERPTFLPSHCSDKFGPVLFGQSLQASQSGPKTDILDVLFGVIFSGRCPSRNDVTNTVGMVLCGIGAKQNESSSQSEFDGPELDEGIVRLLVALTFPMSTCNPPDMKRVAVF